MKVLVVDDDEEGCYQVTRLLKRRGLDASCANSWTEMMACIRSCSYVCIVLDLGLPDRSDSMHTARSIPEIGDIPVVVLTGSDDRGLIGEVVSHGAKYAHKPCDPVRIMEKVLLSIAAKEPTRELEEAIVEVTRQPVEKKPGWMNYVPVMALALSLVGASATGGMFIYRGIAEKATDATVTKEKLRLLDEYVLKSQNQLERFSEQQRELQAKATASLEDRSGIHREMGQLLQQQKELKEDVVRRLERIEDHQLQILHKSP